MTNFHALTRHTRVRAAMISACAILAACGSDTSEPATPPVPRPGALNAVLSTPNTNDGALMFTIAGGPVDSVTAADAKLLSGSLSTSGIIVMGNVSSGAIVARLWVPDVAKSDQYIVSVTQAAARGTYALQSLTAYRITLTPR